jgi:hypothetical protein
MAVWSRRVRTGSRWRRKHPETAAVLDAEIEALKVEVIHRLNFEVFGDPDAEPVEKMGLATIIETDRLWATD